MPIKQKVGRRRGKEEEDGKERSKQMSMNLEALSVSNIAVKCPYRALTMPLFLGATSSLHKASLCGRLAREREKKTTSSLACEEGRGMWNTLFPLVLTRECDTCNVIMMMMIEKEGEKKRTTYPKTESACLLRIATALSFGSTALSFPLLLRPVSRVCRADADVFSPSCCRVREKTARRRRSSLSL